MIKPVCNGPNLNAGARLQTLYVRAVRQARIVLLATDGLGNCEIAHELGIGRIQAGCWRDRFATGGRVAIEVDFLRQIERDTSKGKELHLGRDNYATHKRPNARYRVFSIRVSSNVHSQQVNLN